MHKRLYIVRGLPGSGKTTYCSSVLKGVFHVENDQYMMRDGKYMFSPRMRDEAIRWCNFIVETAMRRGMDVCVSNTFVKVSHMESMLYLARRHGYEVTVYRTMGDYGSEHNVPAEVIDKMRSDFEDYDGEILIGNDGDKPVENEDSREGSDEGLLNSPSNDFDISLHGKIRVELTRGFDGETVKGTEKVFEADDEASSSYIAEMAKRHSGDYCDCWGCSLLKDGYRRIIVDFGSHTLFARKVEIEDEHS